MISDIIMSLQWWFVLFVLGIGTFPLSYYFFPQFVDRGYGLSKILGIVLLTYMAFLLGTLHLLPFSTLGLLLTSSLLLTFNMYLFLGKDRFHLRTQLSSYVKKTWAILLLEEGLFLVVFVLWAWIRAHEPNINGLEKFMDFGFINSILRTDYFPAKDMWLTPLSINYYYFGHIVTAVLTKLSFLPSSVTYNLMLATIAGLCFSASFSISTTLLSLITPVTRSAKPLLAAGLLSACLVTFSGNLHTIYTLFEAYPNEKPAPFWTLPFAPQSFPNAYWYPNATRFIYNTIHEFPIYSWVVSDLHGHVLDIPFVLLTIAVLLSFFLFRKTEKMRVKQHRFSWSTYLPLTSWHVPFISFLLAILYMTNAWDGIIYLLLTGLILLFASWEDNAKMDKKGFTLLLSVIKNLLMPGAILIAGFVLFSLPFSLYFKPFVSGIGILCAPDFLTRFGTLGPFLFEPEHCQRSPLWQLFILHGFFYFFVTIFLIFLAKTKKIFTSDLFVLFLILLSTLLIAIPEFAYMKDIYPAHYRANTMFKLVFQSFIMLSLSTGYILMRSSLALKSHRLKRIYYPLFVLIVAPLLLTVFVYPYFAVMSYYGELSTYHGLNGTSYLNDRYPTDYAAILWLEKNIQGQPVILEAQGDSYTDYARVSANTGLPTVLGWTVHEWLWRGTYDIPAPRIEEVKTLYESSDIEKTNELLQKYDITYVFIGSLEREKYVELNSEKFKKLGDIVFQKGETEIIRLEN